MNDTSMVYYEDIKRILKQFPKAIHHVKNRNDELIELVLSEVPEYFHEMKSINKKHVMTFIKNIETLCNVDVIPEEFRNDPDVIKAMVSTNPLLIYNIPSPSNDLFSLAIKGLSKLAVEDRYKFLEMLPKNTTLFKTVIDVFHAKLSLLDLPEEILNNDEMQDYILQHYPIEITCITRLNPSTMDKLITYLENGGYKKNNGWNIFKYTLASNQLSADNISRLINLNPTLSFNGLKNRKLLTADHIIRILELKGDLIRYLAAPNEAQQLAALRSSGWNLKYIQTPTNAALIQAVKASPAVLNTIPVSRQTDEICIAAVESNPDYIKYIRIPKNEWSKALTCAVVSSTI